MPTSDEAAPCLDEWRALDPHTSRVICRLGRACRRARPASVGPLLQLMTGMLDLIADEMENRL